MTATSLVADASVALKWYLEDESDRPAALRILDAWRQSRLVFLAPSYWPLEVANGPRHAATRKARQLAKKSREALVDFHDMGIPTTDVMPHLRAIYDEAFRLRVSIYDMGYIHLAEREGVEMVTADDRLLNAVKARKPFVKHLRDYKLRQPS